MYPAHRDHIHIDGLTNARNKKKAKRHTDTNLCYELAITSARLLYWRRRRGRWRWRWQRRASRHGLFARLKPQNEVTPLPPYAFVTLHLVEGVGEVLVAPAVDNYVPRVELHRLGGHATGGLAEKSFLGAEEGQGAAVGALQCIEEANIQRHVAIIHMSPQGLGTKNKCGFKYRGDDPMNEWKCGERPRCNNHECNNCFDRATSTLSFDVE